MNAIDTGKKDLYDSIPIIAEQDNFRLLFDVMKHLHERQELCRAAMEMKPNKDIQDGAARQLEYLNERVKRLLRL